MSKHIIYQLISYLIPVVQILFLIVLLVLAMKKKKGLELGDKSYSIEPFKLIAVGALLSFFPTPVGFFNTLLGYNPTLPYAVSLMFMLQAFGAFLMLFGFVKVRSLWKSVGLDKIGFRSGVVGSALGLVANLQSAYVHRLFYGGSVIFGTFMYAFAAMFLVIAFLEMSKRFTRFRTVGFAMLMLAISLIIVYIRWDNDANEGIYCDLASCVFFDMMPTMLISAASFAVAMLGVRVSGAQLKEKSGVQAGGSVEAKSTLDVPVAKTQHVVHQQMEVECKPEVDSKATELAPENNIFDKLKSYDDNRLRKIVDSPRLYTPAVVDRARQLLSRREAWEVIKDLADAELFEMTVADKGLYDNDIVEAASMELYQRGSQLLRDQFAALTSDTLAAIADGTAPAPEGIRLAARAYLSKK
ncbi:MAG: hypothetical protein K2L73_06245 [Muribaculaceae bacterium]|nr:hypothetical protein [Muribaculaceae bacterium]